MSDIDPLNPKREFKGVFILWNSRALRWFEKCVYAQIESTSLIGNFYDLSKSFSVSERQFRKAVSKLHSLRLITSQKLEDGRILLRRV